MAPASTGSGEERFVVVIGDALIDEIHLDGAITEFVGGAALNVAVGLAALGVRAKLIAMIGDDDDGHTIRTFLGEKGVELIATIGPNGSSRGISHRVAGEPRYEFNSAARARRIEFDRRERDAIAAAALVVVSCFPFDDSAQSLELVAAIEDQENRLIIDPNPREGMMGSIETFRETFDRVARRSLLVKVGDDDSALLYGSTLGELESHLLAVGCAAVLGTAGKDGAEIVTSNGVASHEPIVALPGSIVDTMGAGDAVLASVTESILVDGIPKDEQNWHGVLERAMRVAAATCRHEGALLRLP
jgi:sugar/nucleoside kinase (ribokinase family)